MSMTFRDILRLGILACIFATPFIGLYVADGMFFPFISGKNFWFRILVELMLGMWVLLTFIDATYRPKFSWILGAAGIFVGVLTVADLNGVNPFRSIWSSYERMEGLVTHIHLFFYLLIAGSVIVTEELWNWFWATSLGGSLLVAFYALSQLSGKSEIHQSATRLDATFGNSTYLAVYALFHVFLAVFLYFRIGKRSVARWIYPSIALINFAVLYYTQTRGALLGVLGGAFLAFLLVAFLSKEHPEWRKRGVAGLVLVVLAVGLFFTFRDSTFIKSSPTLSRMASISLNDATTNSRFMIWQMSWEGFKERPILGWGQENFLYVFGKYYNPKMYNQEPWFDRSHDVFFDWLIAGGALGLLTYLSLFVVALYYLWFGKKKQFTVLERSILTGMLGGYFIHNIFVFDSLTSYIFFFGFLAYVHGMTLVHEEKTTKVHKKEEALEGGDFAIIGGIILLLTVGLIYYVNIRNMNANTALINAIRPETIMIDEGNGKKSIAMAQVLDPDLLGTNEAREQLIQIAIQAADPRVDPTVRQQFYDLTSSEIEKVLAEDPANLRVHSFAAAFYSHYQQYDKALIEYNKSIELSPTRQSTYYDLVTLYLLQGKVTDAEQTAKKAFDIDPATPDARSVYANVLIHEQKYADAEVLMKEFVGTSEYYDPQIVNAYGYMKNYAKVIELLNLKIAKNEMTAQDYFPLGAAYAGVGQMQNAIAAITKAGELDTSLKAKADEMIGQLQGIVPVKK